MKTVKVQFDGNQRTILAARISSDVFLLDIEFEEVTRISQWGIEKIQEKKSLEEYGIEFKINKSRTNLSGSGKVVLSEDWDYEILKSYRVNFFAPKNEGGINVPVQSHVRLFETLQDYPVVIVEEGNETETFVKLVHASELINCFSDLDRSEMEKNKKTILSFRVDQQKNKYKFKTNLYISKKAKCLKNPNVEKFNPQLWESKFFINTIKERRTPQSIILRRMGWWIVESDRSEQRFVKESKDGLIEEFYDTDITPEGEKNLLQNLDDVEEFWDNNDHQEKFFVKIFCSKIMKVMIVEYLYQGEWYEYEVERPSLFLRKENINLAIQKIKKKIREDEANRKKIKEDGLKMYSKIWNTKVFQIQDSLDAGNCLIGTKSFLKENNFPDQISGIELLLRKDLNKLIHNNQFVRTILYRIKKEEEK